MIRAPEVPEYHQKPIKSDPKWRRVFYYDHVLLTAHPIHLLLREKAINNRQLALKYTESLLKMGMNSGAKEWFVVIVKPFLIDSLFENDSFTMYKDGVLCLLWMRKRIDQIAAQAVCRCFTIDGV